MTQVLESTPENDYEIVDPAWPGIKLRCPICKGTADEQLRCSSCKFLMLEQNGVIIALPPDRRAYYSEFISDYEYIRAAEGRGSHEKEFYLGLPYRDITGQNASQWKIRSRSYDCLTREILVSQSNGGAVLDLGAGNCWLSFRLARRGYRTVAVDLQTNVLDGLGAAKHYHQELGKQFPCIQAEFNCLPFQDVQFDIVIFNASFHYSEDYEITLREALRCTKPEGCVVICDTPWYSRERCGEQMVAERRAIFQSRFETASDSLNTQEFLTDDRLCRLADALSIRWTVHHPWYGFRWSMRPLLARMRGRRQPSQFRIYVARRYAS